MTAAADEGEVGQVRRGPDGFAAQRFPASMFSGGPWVHVFRNRVDGGLQLELLTDEDVAGWPRLGPVVDDQPARETSTPSMREDLSALLNRHGMDTVTGVPDVLLADHLGSVLLSLANLRSRERTWTGGLEGDHSAGGCR